MSVEPSDQTTGRTPWDFATAVLMRLGPTTIVVIGLLGFAFFLYSEINKARLEANKQLIKQEQDQIGVALNRELEELNLAAGIALKITDIASSNARFEQEMAAAGSAATRKLFGTIIGGIAGGPIGASIGGSLFGGGDTTGGGISASDAGAAAGFFG